MAQKLNKEILLDSAVLLAISGFLLSYFRPEYLFSVSITTGGDTASHYYPAKYMKDYLLPNGKITGWMQGNYAGFPIFQFYFPFPFVVMAGLSLVAPLQIAFKLVSVLGILLLPYCAYLCLRLLRYDFPVPVFGALCTLPFLFMEGNSMWGGNIPSTLAGEFAFSLGFALSILFIGSIYNGLAAGGGVVKNGVLLALVGLSHGYALLFSGIASLSILIASKGFLKKTAYLSRVYLLAFMLMGAWILPLLYYMPYTTRYNFVWQINSFFEVFPVILLPLLGAALLGGVLAAGRRHEADWGPLSYLWSCVFISGILYLTAYRINVVDIRFLPFLQIFICLIGGVEAGRFAQRLKLNRLTPVIFCIMSLLWVNHNVKYTGDWIEWNYKGFENKPLWPQFSAINNFLRGGVSEPRVVYEHSSLHNPIGTVRAFESLPLFSGRSTLEGLYMQSSPVSPFVFYLQSEISKEASCPLPDYGCSSLNLKSAVKHLSEFNVKDLIIRSDAVKDEILKYPDFRLKKEITPYRIYELTSNENRYVTPLKYEPVLYITKNWKNLAYKWFKNSGSNDVHIAFAEEPDEADMNAFKTAITSDDLRPLPRIPVNGACSTREEIGNEAVNIKTDCLHRPLLIKISYHPRWKVEGAKKVYLVSPAFMLIFPDREDVTLKFSDTPVEKTGNLMSMTALLMITLNLSLFKGRGFRMRTEPLYRPVTGRLQESFRNSRLFSFTERNRGKISAALLLAIIIPVLIFSATSGGNSPEAMFRKGMTLYDKKKYAEARALFERITGSYQVSYTARDSSYYYAASYYLEGNYPKAVAAFQKLLLDFPESPAAAEAYYHIWMSSMKLNNTEKAAQSYNSLIAGYPDSKWAALARERLRDIPLRDGTK